VIEGGVVGGIGVDHLELSSWANAKSVPKRLSAI